MTIADPAIREGIVERTALVKQLVASSGTRAVLIHASAGYGKSTLLAQWAAADDRPFAWLSARPELRDPIVLLGEVADALASIEPLARGARARITSPDVDFTSVRLPRLAHIAASRTTPFVLVIDDVHLLSSPQAWAALDVLCTSVPEGSQIAFASRGEPGVNVGGLRAMGDLLTIDGEHLAMIDDEGRALLSAAGLDLTEDDATLLVEHTEGWPAALYLAALVLRGADDPGAAARAFAGDDRYVVDYLRDELFGALSDETEQFLTRTSVLDRLSGSLCDFVLERTGSAGVLQSLEASNLLLIPLDRSREWFRYHHLLADALRIRLHQSDPERERELHGRASAWWEEHGDPDRAVNHAAQAGDEARVDALVWKWAPLFVGSGRSATVQCWLDLFAAPEIARRPALAVTAAWCAVTSGNIRDFDHWAQIATTVTPDVALPDGTRLEAPLAMLHATIGRRGIERMREDAVRAYALHRSTSPFRSVAKFMEGAALRLSGDLPAARACCAEAAAVGRLSAPAVAVHALAQLGLIEIELGEWSAAAAQFEDSLGIIDQFGLGERPALVLTFAGAALLAAHDGVTQDARCHAKHATWLMSMMGAIAPWISVEARVLVARASLLVGDVALSRVLCREAQHLVAEMPDSGNLLERIGQIQQIIDSDSTPIGISATPMTPAEMRVLRYLPTHLTFAAIADELFVSRNTVKTQAISIYRKLGVSSRAPAVAAAHDLGLLVD